MFAKLRGMRTTKDWLGIGNSALFQQGRFADWMFLSSKRQILKKRGANVQLKALLRKFVSSAGPGKGGVVCLQSSDHTCAAVAPRDLKDIFRLLFSLHEDRDRIAELKAHIAGLEQERTPLDEKICRLLGEANKFARGSISSTIAPTRANFDSQSMRDALMQELREKVAQLKAAADGHQKEIQQLRHRAEVLSAPRECLVEFPCEAKDFPSIVVYHTSYRRNANAGQDPAAAAIGWEWHATAHPLETVYTFGSGGDNLGTQGQQPPRRPRVRLPVPYMAQCRLKTALEEYVHHVFNAHNLAVEYLECEFVEKSRVGSVPHGDTSTRPIPGVTANGTGCDGAGGRSAAGKDGSDGPTLVLSATLAIDYVDLSAAPAPLLPAFSPVKTGRRGRRQQGFGKSESEPTSTSVWPAQSNDEFELDLLLKQMHTSAEERFTERPKFQFDEASQLGTGRRGEGRQRP
jgi:hypothetical protein